MKIFKRLLSLINVGFKRFYVALGGSVLLFLCTAAVIFKLFDESVLLSLIVSTVIAMLLSVALKLIGERFSLSKRYEYISQSLSALSAALCYPIFGEIFDNEYVTLGWFGVTAVLILVIIRLLFIKADFNTIIPHIIKSCAFSAFISLIVFGGISLCIAAISFLLVDIDYKWYLTALAFAFETLFVWLFLAALPDKDEITIPKAFKIVFLYAAFPLYLALLCVLYLYLIKIAFTLSMPGGQLNWFASFASLFYIVFYYTVLQYDNPFTRFWKRFGGYFLLPIIAVQAFAVHIRVNAYGLTAPRWISIVMSATALLFIVLSLIKRGSYVNFTIPFFAAVLMLSTVTPLNFIDLPVYEQTARLEAILTRNGMLSDGIVTANPAVSQEDMEAIRGCYYVINRSDKAPSYLDGEFYTLFGFEQYESTGNVNFHSYSAEYDEIDVNGYAKLGFFNCAEDKYGTIECIIDGEAYNFDEYFLSLSDTDTYESLIYDAGDGRLFYFTWINFSVRDDGTLYDRYYSGYYLTI